MLVPATSDANTRSTPPDDSVNGDVTLRLKLTGLDLPSSEIVSSLFWTLPAGEAFDPLFATRYTTTWSPASLPEKVKLPSNERTESPSQLIVAVPMASVRPPDEVWPLFGTKSGDPGSLEAAAPAAPGPIKAAPARPATTSQDRGRAQRERRRRRDVFIAVVPEQMCWYQDGHGIVAAALVLV